MDVYSAGTHGCLAYEAKIDFKNLRKALPAHKSRPDYFWRVEAQPPTLPIDQSDVASSSPEASAA
jgi:hypothetical protein